MKIAIITGASSGIGKEFALQMDRGFHNIDAFWLISRRKEQLEELADTLQHPCRILPMDITLPASRQFLNMLLEAEAPQICMLVNCAGYGIMGRFENQETEEALGMIRLNCEALTAVTKLALPYMRRGSRIIQLASSAAFLPQSQFAVYAASKSYVLSFSRALGAELKEKGVYVTSVCPGPVDTPFFDIAEKSGSTLSIKKLTMVSPDKVVKLALKDSYKRKSVSVCNPFIKAFALFSKMTPHDLMLNLMTFVEKLEQ